MPSEADADRRIGIIAVSVLARLALAVGTISPSGLISIIALDVETWTLHGARLIAILRRSKGFEDTLLVNGFVSEVACCEESLGVCVISCELMFDAIFILAANAHFDLAEGHLCECRVLGIEGLDIFHWLVPKTKIIGTLIHIPDNQEKESVNLFGCGASFLLAQKYFRSKQHSHGPSEHVPDRYSNRQAWFYCCKHPKTFTFPMPPRYQIVEYCSLMEQQINDRPTTLLPPDQSLTDLSRNS